MIEQVFKLCNGNEKVIERVISDENVHYLHMVFKKMKGYRNISSIRISI